MEAYRDQYATLFRDGKDVVLFAISGDSAAVQQSWAQDAGFQFTFLSDPTGEVAASYGVGVAGRGVRMRSVFVIDKDGVIQHAMTPFREVDATAYTELGEAINRVAGPP